MSCRTPSVQCLIALWQWAVGLLWYIATLLGSNGQWDSVCARERWQGGAAPKRHRTMSHGDKAFRRAGGCSLCRAVLKGSDFSLVKDRP